MVSNSCGDLLNLIVASNLSLVLNSRLVVHCLTALCSKL